MNIAIRLLVFCCFDFCIGASVATGHKEVSLFWEPVSITPVQNNHVGWGIVEELMV